MLTRKTKEPLALLLLMMTVFLAAADSRCQGYDNTHLFRDAAAGDPEAQYTLGHLFYKGQGGVQQSASKAASWFRRASRAGHQDAMYYLALLLLEDNGSAGQPAEALGWLRKAAALGQLAAQYTLGRAHGLETKQGVYWLEKAAADGYRPAAEYLEAWCTHVPSACRR